jgi:hypothetical protein
MKPVLALILIALSFNTHAALIFDINITSATTAVITGSGTLDEPNPLNYGSYLAFDDVFDAVSPWNPNLSSDNNMTLGGHALWTSFMDFRIIIRGMRLIFTQWALIMGKMAMF